MTAHASADVNATDKARAEKLFKEGGELLEHGHNDEACAKLAESESIVRALGTEYNLGVCLELTHRPASAKRAFTLAATLAKQAGKDSIAKDATARAKKMDASTPRLVLHAPSDAGASLTIRCDGNTIANAADPIELDPGKHRVEATADGRAPFSTTVDLAEARTTEITIVFGASSASQTSKPSQSSSTSTAATKPQPAHDDDAPPWKIVGIGVGAAGVVTLGISAFFALSAKSGKDDSGCIDGRTCPNESAATRLNGAKRDADVSTALAIIGGLFIAGGAVLFFTSPSSSSSSSSTASSATTLRPAIGRDQATLSLSTRW